MLLYQCLVLMYSFFRIKLSALENKFLDRFFEILDVIILLGIIAGVLDGKISLVVTTIIIGLMGATVAITLDEHNYTAILIKLAVVGIVIIYNGGLFSKRIYDNAKCLSFIDEYDFNASLNSIGRKDDDTDYYIVTEFQGEAEIEKLKQFNEKLKAKGRYFLLVLYYDESGNIVDSAYAYQLKSAPDLICEKENENGEVEEEQLFEVIEKRVQEKGIENCSMFIPNSMLASVYDDVSYDEEGELWFDDGEVGVHWVNDYYRADGTHVDGYWRTNPDGDPTNNFSYPGD